ncbi:MAG: hypothetical protein MJZ20_14245, partial [Bacteroidaceae bacterium]|nr:hypothetical protein [Bacteroidaceae bacterium]
RKFFTFVICALCAVSVWGAGPILSESFSYELGYLYGNGGWIKYGANINGPIQLVNNPLTYADYQDNAVGYAAKLAGTNDKDQVLWKRMDASVDPIKTGSVYASFLMNMESAGNYSGGIFFFTLASTGSSKDPGDGGSPSNQGRIFAAPSTNEGKFILAVTKNGGSIGATTETVELNLKQTYLVVLKYTWVVGTLNDNVQVWVNPTKEAEPSTATLTYKDGSSADFSYGIIGVQLRQGGSQTADPKRNAPNVIIDQVRMATNWADLFVQATGSDTPSTDPVISTSPNNLEFTDFKVGETTKKSISVTAANLTEGITISKTSDAISLSKTSITLDELAAGSVNIDVTIADNQEEDFTDVITLTSGETVKEVTVTATVWEPEMKDIATFAFLLNESSTDGIIYNYIGTSAKIMSVVEAGYQIVLRDNSTRTATVILTESQWNEINPVAGMKVSKFTFTAVLSGAMTVKATCTPIKLTFKDADFTREVISLNIGTICINGSVSADALAGVDATFYKILYKEGDPEAPTNIVFEEVDYLEENTPYIFQSNSIGTMKFYTSTAANSIPGNMNGLYGTFEAIDIEPGLYLISNNMICKAGTGCDLAANRAYIKMDEVPVQAQANKTPGRRTISLTNPDGYAAPTGCQNIKANANYRKAMIDGQIVIMNNGNKKNIFGQTIK